MLPCCLLTRGDQLCCILEAYLLDGPKFLITTCKSQIPARLISPATNIFTGGHILTYRFAHPSYTPGVGSIYTGRWSFSLMNVHFTLCIMIPLIHTHLLCRHLTQGTECAVLRGRRAGGAGKRQRWRSRCRRRMRRLWRLHLRQQMATDRISTSQRLACLPPASTMVSPVIKLASSDAMYATAPAISAGSPTRPSHAC